jgi:hypothetical protein
MRCSCSVHDTATLPSQVNAAPVEQLVNPGPGLPPLPPASVAPSAHPAEIDNDSAMSATELHSNMATLPFPVGGERAAGWEKRKKGSEERHNFGRPVAPG